MCESYFCAAGPVNSISSTWVLGVVSTGLLAVRIPDNEKSERTMFSFCASAPFCRCLILHFLEN
jgi:hypothetical protein